MRNMEILRIINRKYAERNMHEDGTQYTINIDSFKFEWRRFSWC
jgi:hypothetical protein